MKQDQSFDRWQRRLLGVLTPALLAALLLIDALDKSGLDSPYTPILLVLLASYGSGLTAYVIKKVIGRDDGSSDQG